MDSDRRIHERMLLGELDPGIQIRWPVAIADCNQGRDSSFASPCDDLVSVGLKLLAIEMCVRVDEHGKWAFWLQGFLVKAMDLRIMPRCRGPNGRFTSVLLLSVRPPENWPGPACRPQAKLPRSFHWIPDRASSSAPGLRRSRPCVRPRFLVHRLPQFRLGPGGLPSRYQFPAAAVYRTWARAPRPSLGQRVIRPSRNHRW